MKFAVPHEPRMAFALVTFPVTVDDEVQFRAHRWCELVKARAGYRCEECGATGVRLHAHHVNEHGRHWAQRNGCEPDNRLSNGQCLCDSCHAKKTHLGRVRTPETCARIGAASKRRHSPEARAANSAAQKGHVVAPETRAKIGAGVKRSHAQRKETQ
jgi:hypothetical protein